MVATADAGTAISGFISYTWDDEEHKGWVRAFTERLRRDGIGAVLDQMHLQPGMLNPQFMERSVRDSQWVLVICTELYKGRFDNREGGAGYEGHIISAELVKELGRQKFIPILRRALGKPQFLPHCLVCTVLIFAMIHLTNIEDSLGVCMGSRTPHPLAHGQIG